MPALAGAALGIALCSAGVGAAPLVNCYDEGRDLVQRLPRGDCKGREVSQAEAAEIRTRRQERVRRIVTRRPEPVAPGRRLGSVGSGFFVDAGGLLLTNLHVVDPCKVISVSTPRGETARAGIEARDGDLDLALLRADLGPEAVAVFADADTASGSRVGVVGYPDQGVPPVKPLLVTGTLKGLGEMPMVRGLPVLGVAGDIRHGHSGAPLLDAQGRVIGVLFAKARGRDIYEKTGRKVGDLGFAVPASLAATFVRLHGAHGPAAPPDPGPPPDLLEHARPFVARVECWR
ncbi:MAG: serine protease [Chromatiales bacterium]|jgi:S1-C subfamily serine protease